MKYKEYLRNTQTISRLHFGYCVDFRQLFNISFFVNLEDSPNFNKKPPSGGFLLHGDCLLIFKQTYITD